MVAVEGGFVGRPIGYDGEGYSIRKVTKERWTIRIDPDIKDSLYGEIDSLVVGEPGRVVNKGDEDYDGTDRTLRTSSSYPEWFRDNEWTAKKAITALTLALEGKSLGSDQASMVESALNSISDQVREAKEREAASNEGHSDESIEEVRRDSEKKGRKRRHTKSK